MANILSLYDIWFLLQSAKQLWLRRRRVGQVMHFKLNPLPSCNTIILTVLGHAISLDRSIANAAESHILFCPWHVKATIFFMVHKSGQLWPKIMLKVPDWSTTSTSRGDIFLRTQVSLSTLLHYISFEIWVVKYSTGWWGHIWGCRL